MAGTWTLFGIFLGTHGVDIELLRPVRVDVFFGRDHFAGFPVGHEEEPVTIGLHQDRRVGSADLQIGQQ
jgi:hypothetical protein